MTNIDFINVLLSITLIKDLSLITQGITSTYFLLKEFLDNILINNITKRHFSLDKFLVKTILTYIRIIIFYKKLNYQMKFSVYSKD